MAVKEKKKKQFDIQAAALSLANAVKKPEANKNTNNKTTVSSKPTRQKQNNNLLTINNKNQPRQTLTTPKKDNTTIKTVNNNKNKKSSIATFDVYERGGKYYYSDNGKEHEIDKKHLQSHLDNNIDGVVGVYDKKGNFTQTNRRGVAKAEKKEKKTIDQRITDIANAVQNTQGYRNLKTAANTATLMGKGALRSLEGVLDFAQSQSDKINNDLEEKATVALGLKSKEEAQKEREEAEKQQSEWTAKNLTEEGLKKAGWNEELQKKWEDGSLVREDNVAGQIAQGIGGMVPSLVAGQALGIGNVPSTSLKGLRGAELLKGIGRNVGTGILANAGGSATLGASAYGSGYEEALSKGATQEQARKYGMLNAGTEFATEMITGGIPGLKQTGILDNMADGLIDKATGKVTNKFLKQATGALLKMGYTGVGEGFEEALADIINPMIKNATYTDGEQINWQDVWRDFFVGGTIGTILGGGNAAVEGVNLANQQIQELNTIADQRIQQIQQEVQQDQTRAQEATQEIEDIQRYVQAETNKIQSQVQTQVQSNETTQPNVITQETQNMLNKENEIDIKEPEYNGKLGPIAQKVDDTLQKIQNKTNGDEYIGIRKNPTMQEVVEGKLKQRQEYLNNTLNRLSQNESAQESTFNNETNNLKKQQNEIIQKTNPMNNEYNTGIRNENDIKTWNEVLNLDDETEGQFAWGDYTREDALQAQKDGKVTVYSSYPIENGNFVSTSKIQATEYAGGDPSKVYSKEVPLNEVAWINGDEGQYAKVDNNIETNQGKNIPATKNENVISEDITPQQEETQQETTETTQQEERKQPEILDKMPTEKKSTIKSLKKGIDTFRKEITDRFAAVYDISQKTRNKTLYHKADRILASDGMAQVDIDTNQVNLNGKPYKNFTDENGNKVSMSLEQAYDIYNKIPNKDKNTFLVNQLNIDRLNQGVDQFEIPMEDSERTIAQLREKYPDIDKWSENIYQYYRNLQDKMVESGRVSQELADKWRTETPHYVHIQRDVQNKGNTGVSVKNGKIDSDNLIRKVKGGTYAILPIKDTTAKFTQNVTRAITYNDFGKEYARTIGYDSQGNNATKTMDLDEMFGLDPEFVNNDGNGNYTMKLYENGGIIEVPISKDVYKSLSPQNIPRIGVLAEATTLYKDLLTNKNPFFGFLRNPIKDVQDMFLYSKHPLAKSMATYTKLFAGRTALRNRAITRDGVTAQDIVDFYHNTGNSVHSIYKNGQFDSENRVKESVDKVLSPVEKGNDFMESMPRITEFWNTIQKEGYTLKDGELVAQKGKKPSKTVEQVIAEASYNAADVTVNFKRGGRTSKAISQNGGIFFNPSVQGASKFVRNITEAVSDAKSGDFRAAKLLVARAAMLGLAPAILSEIMYGDDDEYKDIQDYQKDQYYIIKGEDGKWIRIPKGRAISLFQSATRRGIEKSQGREDAFKGYGQLIGNQIAPSNPLDNNIFSPITSAATNKSWSGNKIVSDSMAKRPVEEQFNEKTDEFSKWIGKKLHISPMKVNYVIDQYSGVLGDLALPQITPKATTGSSNPIMNILRDNYSFDSANSSKSLNDFYEIKSKIQTKARGMNATDKDKIQSKYLGTQSQEMYNLYTEKQRIQMDNSLSKKEKYDQALEVQKKINKKAKDAINGSKDIDINKNYATVGDDTYYKDSGDWKKESEKITQRREELGLTADKYYYYRNEEAYKKPDGKYKYITSGENAKRNIAIVDAFDFDTSDYLEYTYKLSQIKSDKNSSGKTIRNSRKPKVIKYIQSLPISKAQKEYLYKTQYSSYRSADSDLTKQISKSNLSKEEKNEIYSYLNLGR